MIDFKERLASLTNRILTLKENTKTEEATKNAFIMPFIQILGYDVFNPLEVIPEFISDAGNKKGEKVDYCIQKNNEPIMVIECKHWKKDLASHRSQLDRYFTFTDAKFGVLTNGIEYRFYSDFDNDNIMDEIPFLTLSLENLKENEISELNRFRKNSFDIEEIIDSTKKFKNFNNIKELFKEELSNPSSDFVKYFTSKLGLRRNTPEQKIYFTNTVKKALNSVINDTVNKKLHQALDTTEDKEEEVQEKDLTPRETIIESDENRGIYTTQEEMNGYEIIIDILSDIIEKEKIAYRDSKSYFAVLFDDNNRKPICRLHFNTSQKYLGVFDTSEEKKETKIPITKTEHIYKYSNEILATLKMYLE